MTAIPTQASAAGDPTKRNVLLLCGALALSNTGASLIMAVTALSGAYLARPGVEYWLPLIGTFEERALSTLALSVQFIGTMLAAPLAAILMGRIGRRAGFSIGQLIGAFGAGLAVHALFIQDFWLFVLSGGLIGIHNAFWQQYRFAVADTAAPDFKAKAISYVMIGPIVAGLFGPEIAKHTYEALLPVLYAGAYVAVAVLALVAVIVLQFIRIPTPPRPESGTYQGRPMSVIAQDPRFLIAVLAGMAGSASMSFIMTATPLAMIDCGFVEDDAFFVIQGHVIAMFAPSFFTGSLIRHFGSVRVILAGAVLFAASAAINATGIEMIQFFSALVFVGVAWNFMFVGGTTLLTECYQPEERAKVQGINDFLVFGSVAFASLMSGALQQAYGWSVVSLGILGPVLVAALCVVVLQGRAERAAAAE